LARKSNCYLDRFEGDKAILLIDGAEAVIPRALLPADISEGDYLNIEASIDTERRNSVSAEISRLQDDLKSGKGES